MNKNAELENAQLLEAVLKSGVSLPSPGQFLPALQRAGSNDRAGVKEFADAVRGDPAIVGSVMRVANCIVFRPPRKSETLEQAISCIGYAKLLAITSSVALNGYIDLLDPALRESVQLVFDDSNRAADLAYAVARTSNYKRLADYAYLGALLQDAGTIVLAQRSGKTSFLHDPHDAHASLGAAIMRNFKMPQLVSEVVEVHHRPAAASRKAADVHALACLIATGRCLSQHFMDSDEWAVWAKSANEVLGITSDNVMKIHDEYFQGA